MSHNLCTRLAFALVFTTSVAASSLAAENGQRSVPDVPASFALTGDLQWVVLAEGQDGDAAIGLARDQISTFPKVQVARTKDGRYAVLVGPVPVLSAEQLKERFAEGRGIKNVHQSRGEEFVARAWQNVDAALAAAVMSEGKSVSARAGTLTLALRVQQVKKKKKEDAENIVVAEGREDGKVVFTARSEALYSPEPHAKASWVKLEGSTPQAVFGLYTGGAHCCTTSTIATKDASGKWHVLRAGSLDGDGPVFEDLDGDGQHELLTHDNRFLYEFDVYAGSVMPAKIEKLVGGKIVDVSRRPEYRRYHQQYLAALEDRADGDDWKRSGFLAGWVAQKTLLGEGAQAWERMLKTYEQGSSAGFEECTIDRRIDDCPENRKRTISFPDALRKFLDKNGYR